MKELKREILFVLLFMVIGIAAVTTNVVIDMSTPINQNPDDFLVYFSDVKVNGTQDLTLVRDETKLVFDGEFSAVGDKKIVTYDVTNASKDYDANITINCTKSNDYLIIANSFDTDNVLSARSTRTGTLSVELKNAVSEETTQDVTCTISAIAAERENQGSGDVVSSAINPYVIGHEVTIGDELFNVIEVSDTEVQLLAMSALDDEYRQNEEVTDGGWFSGSNGWTYSPGPKEIDIQSFDGYVKIALNNYFDYINTVIPVNKVDLITLKQIENLGCTIPSDYAYSADISCDALRNYAWWSYGVLDLEYWWTKSAVSNKSNEIWMASKTGLSKYVNYATIATGLMGLPGVRPVITLSKEVYNSLLDGKLSFTINDVVYEAEVGMTWEEWIDSEYSSDDFRIKSSQYIVFESVEFVYASDDNIVLISDKIIAGENYYLLDAIS